MPYCYREDIATADVAFDAWGETREELFASAADALLRTMTAAPQEVAQLEEITVRLEDDEPDLLLWSFLQELVFQKDARRLLLHPCRLAIGDRGGTVTLDATLRGEPLDPARHRLLVDVKAVTLHRLRLVREDNLWKATVVLDV